MKQRHNNLFNAGYKANFRAGLAQMNHSVNYYEFIYLVSPIYLRSAIYAKYEGKKWGEQNLVSTLW